jgi:hypothetical protein
MAAVGDLSILMIVHPNESWSRLRLVAELVVTASVGAAARVAENSEMAAAAVAIAGRVLRSPAF